MEISESQCRICLEEGDIPIFGENDQPGISEDIIIFGNIEINKHDDFPKHICDSCFQLLNGAIIFRDSAKHTEQVLRNALCSVDNDLNEHNLTSDTSSDIFHRTDDDTESVVFLDNDSLSTTSQVDHNEALVVLLDNQSDADSKIVDESTYRCDLCNLQCESLEHYQNHIITDNHVLLAKQSSKTSCQICNIYVPEEKYEKHSQLHNADGAESLNMLECTECELQFDVMEDFEEHCNSELHQNTKLRDTSLNHQKVKCTVCGKSVTKSYFKVHVKLHGSKEEKQELLRQCPYCKKSFVYSYINDHIQRTHKASVPEKRSTSKQKSGYMCDKCGKVFKKQANLNMHILTHGAELKYKCMFCPYRGLHPGLLMIHVRTHTKDYNYECTQCPATFLTKSNLNKHLRRHKGSADYHCSSCEKCYYSKTELNQHYEASHLGVKKHICNVCGKAFGCRNYMMCHQLRVHKRKKVTDGKGRLPSYLANETKKADLTEDGSNVTS